jgi:hypothetical protein
MTEFRLPPSFPLCWPDGWARTPTHKQRSATYRTTFSDAMEDLRRSLELMGARQQVITTNRSVGDRMDPDDCGVAAWWLERTAYGEPAKPPQVIAVDSFGTLRENVRAVGLSVEALRSLKRTGATQVLARAAQAFDASRALPASASRRDWRTVLGLGARATVAEVESAYRARARKLHPDVGGNPAEWLELNDARRDALAELGNVGARA